jgi:hypothetical protein
MSRTQPYDQRTRREHECENSGGDDGATRSYSDCQRQELLQRAHELDVGGRAAMTKPELIDALRDIDAHGESRQLSRACPVRSGRTFAAGGGLSRPRQEMTASIVFFTALGWAGDRGALGPGFFEPGPDSCSCVRGQAGQFRAQDIGRHLSAPG